MQGYVPTLMEDVPDMAVKFAVYETMRITHASLHNNRQPSTLEDLVMGGAAGAAAAAATTPLDVIKTRMMCTASQRPTIATAARTIMAEGDGLRAFFRGVGPRALSNGINSAVFFCFFEAIRRVSVDTQALFPAADHSFSLLKHGGLQVPLASLMHSRPWLCWMLNQGKSCM